MMTQPVQLLDPAHPKLDAARNIALAGELASYARAGRDPLAMIEAARLLAALPDHHFTPGATTANALYGEARLLANRDPKMLAEIDGAQHGIRRTINCYAQESWVVAYRGNGLGLAAQAAPRVQFRVGTPQWFGVQRTEPQSVH